MDKLRWPNKSLSPVLQLIDEPSVTKNNTLSPDETYLRLKPCAGESGSIWLHSKTVANRPLLHARALPSDLQFKSVSNMETWRHGDMETWRHGDIVMVSCCWLTAG